MMSERQGVEIDYSPECRGIWLDRGELDKIIERVDGGSNGGVRREDERSRYSQEDDEDNHREKRDEREYGYGDRKKKKGGFLGDLLDFGGD
jgi:Zn-finger nucleic acid-binding protein